MPEQKFVHLHIHSEYSLLNSTCRLPQLIKKARDCEMSHLALTDYGNMFGAIEFYEQCTKNGINPIIGCDIYVAPESRFERVMHGLPNASHNLVLLCQNETGYRNLMRLVSLGYLEGFYYKPRVDKELLRAHHDGLIALSGSYSGEVTHLLNIGQYKQAKLACEEFKAIFGDENFYLEVIDTQSREQERLQRELKKLSEELNIPLVAATNVHYMERADAHLLDILNCIRGQKTMQDQGRTKSYTSEYYFKTPKEMTKSFKHMPEALENTLRVAERCQLKIDLSTLHLPHFVPPSNMTQSKYLEHLVQEGLKSRYTKLDDGIQQRVATELSVIGTSGYESYFLIVWDFIRFAREKGIPVGPGRGSAAGSVVSYALGITDIDPLRYDLLFERFLNPERVTMPDIDIDFCFERRDEVIRYVTEKYSKDNVAQIITFGTMMAKGVIRDVGRVLGLAYAEVDRLAKLIPNELNITIKEALKQEPQLQQLINANPQIAELIEISKGLEGLSRHASTHAAGVVISRENLTQNAPLFKTSDGQISTMYPMMSLEKIGLLKMDFLGLRTLTVIDDTVKIIKRTRKQDLDLNSIPLDDKKTYATLSRAQSIGVFQLESSGMRDILKKLKPSTFEDVIAILALYRPGPIGSGMVDDFIKRKNGTLKFKYDHPALEPILKDTYGIIVYQEQIMKIVNALAGFSLAQADSLRRAISKKKPEIIEQKKKDFSEGCAKKQIDHATADKIFQLIMYFAGYGFNKSHSAAYAMISYRTVYLKTHYPVEFMTALLSSENNNTDKVVQYIDECKRMGLEVLPPDVNESFPRFTVVGPQAIRFGLAAVKNVGQSAIDAVIQARIKYGRFKTLYGFAEHVDSRAVNRKTVESLIRCGAFDSLKFKRSQLFQLIQPAINHAAELQRDRKAGQLSLFDQIGTGAFKRSLEEAPDIEEWTPEQKLGYEKELLGFYVTGHPLERYKHEFQTYADVNIATISQCNDGDEVLLGALINRLKFTQTKKKGERMAILTLEDTQGLMDALVFPRVFQTCERYLVADAILFFKGRVDKKEEAPKLIVQEVHAISDVQNRMTRSVLVEIKSECSEVELNQLQGILSRHNGQIPVYLRFQGETNGHSDVIVDRSLFVSPNEKLIKEIESFLGENRVHLQV